MEDWWSELDGEILSTLIGSGPLEPAEIARRSRMPEASAASLIAGLVTAGKVRVCLVDVRR